jgi:TolA-binding protein
MFKMIALQSAIVLVLAINSQAQDIGDPKLTPAPQSDKHRELLREGVGRHDVGDYNGAIAKYQEILRENPDDIEAIYELGFSLSASREYQKSNEVAYRGAQYKSNLLQRFYTLIGNNLDHLGQSDKAIKVYRQGIKQFPSSVQLQYNLAIAQMAANKVDDAKKTLKEAVSVGPEHPGSHFVLCQLYLEGNYKIPALMAACRFLFLEPNTTRSNSALRIVMDLLESGVQKGSDPNKISVLIDTSEKTDEGDFTPLTAALSLVAAGRYLEESKGKSEVRLFVDTLSTLLAIMSEADSKKKGGGFAWQYYRPYFCEMARRKLVEPFCYYIAQSQQSDEVSRWLSQNQERVRELMAWSKDYQWRRG